MLQDSAHILQQLESAHDVIKKTTIETREMVQESRDTLAYVEGVLRTSAKGLI